MNRIAILHLVRGPGGRTWIEGVAGDVKFIVRRHRENRDLWVLMTTPPPVYATENERVIRLPPESQSARAAEAARELLERLVNPTLDDPIDDLFDLTVDASAGGSQA